MSSKDGEEFAEVEERAEDVAGDPALVQIAENLLIQVKADEAVEEMERQRVDETTVYEHEVDVDEPVLHVVIKPDPKEVPWKPMPVESTIKDSQPEAGSIIPGEECHSWYVFSLFTNLCVSYSFSHCFVCLSFSFMNLTFSLSLTQKWQD